MPNFRLSPQAVAQKYRLDQHELVSSTNVLAAEYAKDGDGGHLWVVATQQAQGKGRRGRVWHSPAGNLYASLLLIEEINQTQAASLGFVAGVSLVEAIVAASPDRLALSALQLKWPNDVLLNGAKLAGILLEHVRLPKLNKAALIIGLGVNITQAPRAEFYPTISLKSGGIDVTPNVVFTHLSHFWAQNFSLWHKKDGLDTIRQKWLERAVGLGGEVHVLINQERLSGIFETIDEQCQLVIATDSGKKITVPAGDVHFGTVSSWRP